MVPQGGVITSRMYCGYDVILDQKVRGYNHLINHTENSKIDPFLFFSDRKNNL